MIAWYGIGLLGSGFVRALRKRGEEVRVWNRTHAKAKALEADGAKAFEDPAEAARGASRIHLTLSDDAAVDDVLGRARAGFEKDVVIVDHTTTTATGSAARAKAWKSFLHAPVFMGPQNALESTGIMLASGDEALFTRLRPALEKMTGTLRWLGAKPETAAAFKLLGNLHLMFLQTGFADLLALAKAFGVSPSEAGTLFENFNPGNSLAARYKRMTDRAYENPSWELAMARKDARLMEEEAARANLPLIMVPALAKLMDEKIAQGHGHADWTVVGNDVA